MKYVLGIVLDNKKKIIFLFKCTYFLILIFLIVAGYVYISHGDYTFFYELAVKAGQTAILVFIITLLPGILRRFGYSFSFIPVIISLRRYFGILVYMLSFFHYFTVRFIPTISLQSAPTVFEFFGLLAFSFLLPVFLTSNDYSIRKLGKWWRRIHSLVYIIVWFIFFHTAFQQINIWSILIGVTAFLETVSLIYYSLKNKKQ